MVSAFTYPIIKAYRIPYNHIQKPAVLVQDDVCWVEECQEKKNHSGLGTKVPKHLEFSKCFLGEKAVELNLKGHQGVWQEGCCRERDEHREMQRRTRKWGAG